MKKMLLGLFCALTLLNLGQAQEAYPSNVYPDIYYEVFVRSFQDSDNDGIGDFVGLTQRLDYLQDLGITGIWLMPIQPSPSYHGYDVTDYYAVNPDYGSLEEFEAFLLEAHSRNIKVIIDLVVNHSSSEHPWFLKSKLQEVPYRDYYIWQDGDPNWRGVSGAAAFHKSDTAYYLGLFWGGMPDLNYRNPDVVKEMNTVAKFWLELGVDGFRIDAIQHILESETGDIRNIPETFEWTAEFETYIKSVNKDAFLVGETWTDTQTIVKYHEAGLDMSFNYPLFNSIFASIQSRSAGELKLTLEQDESLYPASAQRGTFISNHDQVRPATSLGALRRDEARLKLAAGLLLTLPGVPFLYYGEEIGLPNGSADNDEAKRIPMAWDDSVFAGFSTHSPWLKGELYESQTKGISVKAQENDSESVLNWYKTLIKLRKATPALALGTLQVLDTDALEGANRALLAFERTLGEQRVLVLANLNTKDLSLDLSSLGLNEFTDLLTGEKLGASVELGGLGLRVFEILE